MSWLSKIADTLTGGLAGTILDTVKAYIPPGMTPQQEADLKLSLERLELEKQKEVNKAVADAEKAINARIAEYEGTASDLKAIPIIGPILIFARGAQRPVWGFATLYFDFLWFTGDLGMLAQDGIRTLTEKQEVGLIVINFLVLGFLFGERAVKNLIPIISQYMGKK